MYLPLICSALKEVWAPLLTTVRGVSTRLKSFDKMLIPGELKSDGLHMLTICLFAAICSAVAPHYETI